MNLQKFLAKTFGWESIAKILFWALAELIDLLVIGEEMTKKEKKSVQLAWAFGKIFGETWVDETDTLLDNEALENILTKCEDTATEGKFKLPECPEV